MIRRDEPVEVGPKWRLTEDQPDPWHRDRPAVAVDLGAKHGRAADRSEPENRRRDALAEAAQVLAESSLDRSGRAALEPLDEATDQPNTVFEREPGVALAELRRIERADAAGRDTERGSPARLG